MPKKPIQLKLYGTAKYKVKTHKRRVWKTRKDGIEQRYWKRIRRYTRKEKYVEKRIKAETGKEAKEKIKEEIEKAEWIKKEVEYA